VDVERAIMGATSRISVERIVIELEIPRDSGSLFRLRLDNKVVGEHLTAVQTHLLVGGFSIGSLCHGSLRENERE
jgi:hypothetical protein